MSRPVAWLPRWTLALPAAGWVLLAGSAAGLGGPYQVVVALGLLGAVFASVHHAEVVSHRVGQPFGALVLVGGGRFVEQRFELLGVNGALSTLAAIVGLTLILPAHHGPPGRRPSRALRRLCLHDHRPLNRGTLSRGVTR